MLNAAATEPIPLSTGADGVIRVADTWVTLSTVTDNFLTGGLESENRAAAVRRPTALDTPFHGKTRS